MVQIKENIFEQFCKISQLVQKMDQELREQSVTPQKRVELNQFLEKLQGSLQSLRQEMQETHQLANRQFIQFEELNAQMIRLYRDIEDRFEDYEISLISKDALKLSSAMESGKLNGVAKLIESLSHNIHYLFKHRKPSMGHRKVLHMTKRLLGYAQESLASNGVIARAKLSFIHLFTQLLEDALARSKQVTSIEDAELAMELLAISELLLEKKEKQAQLRLSLIRELLKRDQRRRLDAAQTPDELIEVLQSIASGASFVGWQMQDVL